MGRQAVGGLTGMGDYMHVVRNFDSVDDREQTRDANISASIQIRDRRQIYAYRTV